MIVTRDTFHGALAHLKNKAILSCDTETTGLVPYKYDELFSIIIADESRTFYFNFLN